MPTRRFVTGVRSDWGKELPCDPLALPSRRRRCVEAVCEGLHISERRACRALGQARSTQRHRAHPREDEDALTAAVTGLARSCGRYGYKRITGLLQMARASGVLRA
jgi:putative transposase